MTTEKQICGRPQGHLCVFAEGTEKQMCGKPQEHSCKVAGGPEKQRWDRLPEETDAAWRAFNRYLALGPWRQPSQLTKGRKSKRASKWFGMHNWQKRATEYDYQRQKQARANLAGVFDATFDAMYGKEAAKRSANG